MNGWGIFDEKVSGERKKFRLNIRVEPFSLLLYSFFYRCVLGWKAHIRWMLGKIYFSLSTFDRFSRSWLTKILEIQVQLPCNGSSVNYSRAFDSVEDFWVRKFQFNFDYDLWMARRYVQWMLSILSFSPQIRSFSSRPFILTQKPHLSARFASIQRELLAWNFYQGGEQTQWGAFEGSEALWNGKQSIYW